MTTRVEAHFHHLRHRHALLQTLLPSSLLSPSSSSDDDSSSCSEKSAVETTPAPAWRTMFRSMRTRSHFGSSEKRRTSPRAIRRLALPRYVSPGLLDASCCPYFSKPPKIPSPGNDATKAGPGRISCNEGRSWTDLETTPQSDIDETSCSSHKRYYLYENSNRWLSSYSTCSSSSSSKPSIYVSSKTNNV